MKKNVVDIRDYFDTDYIFLINERYRHIDREAVAELLIDQMHLNEAQASILMAAAYCVSGDRLAPYATGEDGTEYDLLKARRELHEMKLITLYEDAMVVDWLDLSCIVGYSVSFVMRDDSDKESEEEIRHQPG